MSLFSGAKNNKFYYPPIVKPRKSNIHLSDINNLKSIKPKKNNTNNNKSLKAINQILHITKSNSYNNITNRSKKNDLIIRDQDNNSLLLNIKTRSNSKSDKYKYVDNESLYERNIQLKTEINQIKKELLRIKAENQRKEQEIIKKDKLLFNAFDKKNFEDNELESIFMIDIKKNNENNTNNMLDKVISKNNYMSKFKKQYNELKKKYEEKIAEVNSLKKNIKNSKLNELNIQIREIMKEYNKLKEMYINLFEENKKNLEKNKRIIVLENELNDKNLIILQLQESLKISSSTNIKYENDLEELKTSINNLQAENKNLLEKLKKLYESYNKISARKKEKENKYLELYEEKRKSDINFNNTNRSFLNIANRINTDIRAKNVRNSLNNSTNRKISPLSKKIPVTPNNSNLKKSNINDITNSINIRRESNNEINFSKIKEDESIELNNMNNNNNNNEEENNININDNIELNASFNNDISQTSYILIKNFEACKISKEDSLTIIIKPILNEISNEKQIKNDILVNLFTEKICESINCKKNNNDINSISNLINSLLNDSKYELFPFIKAFLDMFDSVKIYTDISNDEEGIIKKINESLVQYKEYFENSYRDKFISFSNFRGLLNNKNIILNDESIEYLIYRMKKDCPNIISINQKMNKKEEKKENDNTNNNINTNNKEKENEKEETNNNKEVKENKEIENKDIIEINNGNNNVEVKNEIINDNQNNINNKVIIDLNNANSNNIQKTDETPNKIVNISQDDDINKNIDIEKKNQNNNGNIPENILQNSEEDCSIFDLNYKTFLNLI